MDRQTLTAALKNIAEEHWQQRRQPVFLSALPPLLDAMGLGNYKDVLGTQTLRNFVKESGPSEGYRLVEHATLRAKLAIVPLGVPFDFNADSIQSKPAEISRADVDAFFRVLTFMSDDIPNLSLPASAVAKLFAIR